MLTPTRIHIQNHFAIKQVKEFIHIPDSPIIRRYQEDIRSILQRVYIMSEND